MWWKGIIVWFVLMVGAIANGAVRVKFLIPNAGEGVGHVVSTLMLCVIILVITWVTIGWVGPDVARTAFALGVCWLLMTLVFEFGVGYFIGHHTWTEMLADYNVFKGRVWVLVLITTALAPWIMAKVRGLIV
ncbi:MAG: hypothetical protein ABI432_04455 [Flavobacteriales bacterium]